MSLTPPIRNYLKLVRTCCVFQVKISKCNAGLGCLSLRSRLSKLLGWAPVRYCRDRVYLLYLRGVTVSVVVERHIVLCFVQACDEGVQKRAIDL